MVLKLEILEIYEDHIKEASQVIKKGGIVVYPTESFYGIGADATNEEAIKRILRIKKRRETNPILLIIGNKKMLYSLIEDMPDIGHKLINRFWPGPLTIVFKASKNVLPVLTASTGKIGIRMSGNPVARKLSEFSGVPITGTSANISGRPPCKSADEVIEQLQGVDLVLDAGFLDSKAATTVIDVTEKPARIIRKGLIPERLIMECIGEIRYA